VKEAEAKRWADSHELPIFFTSAKTGQGIEDLKKRLAKRFSEMKPEGTFETALEIKLEKKKEGNCC
jgi:selenocysteine-specific translation elongation factor